MTIKEIDQDHPVNKGVDFSKPYFAVASLPGEPQKFKNAPPSMLKQVEKDRAAHAEFVAKLAATTTEQQSKEAIVNKLQDKLSTMKTVPTGFGGLVMAIHTALDNAFEKYHTKVPNRVFKALVADHVIHQAGDIAKQSPEGKNLLEDVLNDICKMFPDKLPNAYNE